MFKPVQQQIEEAITGDHVHCEHVHCKDCVLDLVHDADEQDLKLQWTQCTKSNRKQQIRNCNLPGLRDNLFKFDWNVREIDNQLPSCSVSDTLCCCALNWQCENCAQIESVTVD